MIASFQELLVALCSLCSLLGSVCMNTLRLLSLKMAAAIPGSNSPFSVNGKEVPKVNRGLAIENWM